MSIHSTTSHIVTEGQVEEQTFEAPEALQGYAGSVGEAKIFAESFVNERALFEALITNDFKEAMLNESSPAEEVTAIYEASTKGFLENIRKMFESLWAKLRGLIASFKKTVRDKVLAANAKLVEATRKKVEEKDLSKMKYTWREPKNLSINDFGSFNYEKKFSDMKGMTAEQIDDIAKKADGDEQRLSTLNAILGTNADSVKGLSAAADKEYFGEAKEEEGLDKGRLASIISTIVDAKEEFKYIDELEKKVGAGIKRAMDEIEKISKGVEDGDANAGKAISVLNKYAASERFVDTKAVSIAIEIAKTRIKLARGVYSKAVAFRAKAVEENALLVEAAGDVSDYEFDLAFEI